MSDLRAFVETKMFSKSEKNLEKVGLDTGSANGKRPLQHAVRRSIQNTKRSNNSVLIHIFSPPPNPAKEFLHLIVFP